MTDPSLAVTGLGLVTAAGMGVDATWEGVLRGRSAGARDERLAGLPVDIACAVPGLQPARHVDRRSVLIHDRFVQLARGEVDLAEERDGILPAHRVIEAVRDRARAVHA